MVMLEPNVPLLEANGLVVQLKADICSALVAATGAPRCEVYALQPHPVVIGVSLMANLPSQVIPIYLQMNKVMTQPLSYFSEGFRRTYNVHTIYGNVLTAVAIPPPPSPPPRPPTPPLAPPEETGLKGLPAPVPTTLKPAPATAAAMSMALATALGVVSAIAILATAAAVWLAYQDRKMKRRADGFSRIPRSTKVGSVERGKKVHLWGSWQDNRQSESLPSLLASLSVTPPTPSFPNPLAETAPERDWWKH
jgi:hypothetical protein